MADCLKELTFCDEPSTPFDETSVGRYMPGYLKMHCNDDDTVTVRHYHDQACSPR